jgi:rhamnose utilization protein RhaD (predicted bifunctional aldolase and dehydrogenase)/NAD(P)-dependent dehydrogenase (short-subunit alcohol dehydrogenase family)
MESLYDQAEAQRALDRYAPRHGEDLALRVYTSRLLGQEPGLVLHGGGNTSVKSRVTELLGDLTEVLYVKGSGADLSQIEPRGFPACRLAHLRRLCERPTMSDEEMVAQLRGQMIDPSSPTPSVEALLHAFLPAKFVDHTHADAVLALVDQPRSAELMREIYGDRALFVPYVMPGFALVRRVAELWQARAGAPVSARGGEPISSPTPASRKPPPTVMILDKHGIFTWGDSAQQSYERMISAVSLAEAFIDERRAAASRRTLSVPPAREVYARVAPVIRGALTRASGKPWILSWRTSPDLLAFTERADLARVSQMGCATPDHVIRTRVKPLLLKLPQDREGPEALRTKVEAAIGAYAEAYHDYFRRCSSVRPGQRTELDPLPRVILVEGLGALTLGRTHADAAIAADIYEHTATVIDAATALEGYRPAAEIDLFDVEYWSLEQAKLGKAAADGPLERKIALITGAASAVGTGVSRALLAAGAHVLLSDRDPVTLDAAAAPLAARYPGRVLCIACDPSSPAEVKAAVAAAAEGFGGLDLVISSAGAPDAGLLHSSSGDAALRASMEVNLLAHQNVARAAAELMIAQGTGGALLFHASKSAPGADLGPHAVSRAALLALMRQYAVDLAPFGVRAGAIDADQPRVEPSGRGAREAWAKARGVAVEEPQRANLLHRETTVDDVARAFLFLCTAEATTGCVISVDGGSAAAFLR